MRFAMTVAYDGTAYQGWQVQPDAPTVQEVIEQAFGTICNGVRPRIQGSGRTDTGVHARGQVFHVDPDREDYSPDKWQISLNGVLPEDVRIINARQVAPEFHARYNVLRKEYRFFLQSGGVMPPDQRHSRLYVRKPLNLDLMSEGCALLTGMHDFTSFSANRGVEEENPVRTIEELSIHSDENGFFIKAIADGFLYKMVRRLTGALIKVGGGDLSLSELAELLNSPRRDHLIPTAPPHGLFLWEVTYPEDS